MSFCQCSWKNNSAHDVVHYFLASLTSIPIGICCDWYEKEQKDGVIVFGQTLSYFNLDKLLLAGGFNYSFASFIRWQAYINCQKFLLKFSLFILWPFSLLPYTDWICSSGYLSLLPLEERNSLCWRSGDLQCFDMVGTDGQWQAAYS